MPISEHKYIPFGHLIFSNSNTLNLLCMLHCTTHAQRFLPLAVHTIFLSYYTPIRFNWLTLSCILPKPQDSNSISVSFEVYSIVFSDQLFFGLIWVSQSIQTISMAPGANKILSLAHLALSTWNLFPRVMHIGSALMVVAFNDCASAALTKLCVVPQLIKTML